MDYPSEWIPPSNWLRMETIDLHAGGEPLRVILRGWPVPPGSTVLERRMYALKHQEHLRTSLMHEPRGHADMYGCLIVPPDDKDADFGVIFMHNAGYSTMCGHAVIALGRLAVESKWVKISTPETEVKIDAPCGRITAYVRVDEGRGTSTSFEGVPSFAVALDQRKKVHGLGEIKYDLAYGGTFYAYVDAKHLGLDLTPANSNEIVQTGMTIKRALASDPRIRHPYESDLSFLYGVIFVGEPHSDHAVSRHVCVFADGELDRSATGSGVMGRLAILFARGEIAEEEVVCIEGITGSVFRGLVKRKTQYDKYEAVIPVVEGEAYVTGMHTFLIDPEDPMSNGFLLKSFS